MKAIRAPTHQSRLSINAIKVKTYSLQSDPLWNCQRNTEIVQRVWICNLFLMQISRTNTITNLWATIRKYLLCKALNSWKPFLYLRFRCNHDGRWFKLQIQTKSKLTRDQDTLLSNRMIIMTDLKSTWEERWLMPKSYPISIHKEALSSKEEENHKEVQMHLTPLSHCPKINTNYQTSQTIVLTRTTWHTINTRVWWLIWTRRLTWIKH